MDHARPYLAPSRPFDLSRHRYLEPIYADSAREAVYMKAGQVGISEYLISWILWSADERKATGLYVFPTDTHVSDFSAARLGPAIEPGVSQYLAGIVVAGSTGGQRGADRVTLKRIRDRFIYFRGAQVSKDGRAPQLRSIDADALVLDEYDEMDAAAPPLARERLGHSGIAETRIASTPTYSGVGVHALYLASDQRAWHVACPHCGSRQPLEIGDLVTAWDPLGRPSEWHGKGADPFLACRKCAKPLDRGALGEWVPAYPDRPVHGYHISRLFTAYRPLAELLESLSSLDENKRQQAYNQGLGLPYRSPTALALSDEILDACRREYALGRPPKTDTFCGVDVGSVLHVVIRERVGDDLEQRYAGMLTTFDQLEQICKQYRVAKLVIDALPETRSARKFQAGQKRGMVWLAYYVNQAVGSKKEDPRDWNAKEGAVNMDRTRTLDETLGKFLAASQGEPGSTLPASARAMRDYYAHLKAPERVLRRTEDGTQVPAYIESGPDHFAHAENYCAAAAACPYGVGWARGAG
jgi:hypothetical protein